MAPVVVSITLTISTLSTIESSAIKRIQAVSVETENADSHEVTGRTGVAGVKSKFK